MTTYREIQFNAHRMLLCAGAEHACEVPELRHGDGGATGPVECAECGERMSLVDVITVEREASWGFLDRRGRMYTTAKLHPVAMLTAMAREAS